MRTDAFDFDLPPDLIADRPAIPRETARLLAVGEQFLDRTIADLPDFLMPGDGLVVNDTLVIPARLTGRRGAARIEVTLLRPTDDPPGPDWRALARPAKRLRPGDRIVFGENFAAEMVARGDDGEITLRFSAELDLAAALDVHGSVPLPPYIRRPEGPDWLDRADYQTVYARRPGAVAAPTAGLHLSASQLDRLAAAGIVIIPVTLHVGAGTFVPVKAETTDRHVMHTEWAELSDNAVAAILAVRQAGGRIVAVGTTSLRVLETATARDGTLAPFRGDTDLFITPGYRFRMVDALLTNFHLPRSTLFMLVAAFCGLDRMLAAYAHARDSGYRFYSYGDACFLTRMDGR